MPGTVSLPGDEMMNILQSLTSRRLLTVFGQTHQKETPRPGFIFSNLFGALGEISEGWGRSQSKVPLQAESQPQTGPVSLNSKLFFIICPTGGRRARLSCSASGNPGQKGALGLT